MILPHPWLAITTVECASQNERNDRKGAERWLCWLEGISPLSRRFLIVTKVKDDVM